MSKPFDVLLQDPNDAELIMALERASLQESPSFKRWETQLRAVAQDAEGQMAVTQLTRRGQSSHVLLAWWSDHRSCKHVRVRGGDKVNLRMHLSRLDRDERPPLWQVYPDRIYRVKQANRHDLVCQLRDMLGSQFPFELVRTDISSFYESINRKRLVEKLDRDQLLSPASKKYIKQVLDSYGAISGAVIGVPRGVGISAYLAELYLRPVDKAIRAIPGLVLYCRFVDDIVAVFARPPAGKDLGSFKDLIITIFGENGLAHNPDKTSEHKLADSAPKKFEYLGYRFYLQPGQYDISPSAAKVAKYRTRMNAAFADYWRERPINPKGAFRKLVGRVKFLTGNTRLSNSKSRAATGIYFNNSLATDLSSLAWLDKRLKTRIAELKRTSLQKQLQKLKFTTGFQQRRYHNFSTRELQVIVKAWKHG